jgi:hypothetical protein
MSYASAAVMRCRNLNHRFVIVGSDKTPMKKSLLCRTCSEDSGNSVYVAYGIDTLGFGAYPTRRKQEESDENS